MVIVWVQKGKAKIEFQLKGAKQNKTKERKKNSTDSGIIEQREEKLHT